MRDIEEYKLISMVFDYTYIEESIAIAIFRKSGMWPTHREYTELRLSDQTQGVNLLIEDPVEYFLYQRDADFILAENILRNRLQLQYNIQKSALTPFIYAEHYCSGENGRISGLKVKTAVGIRCKIKRIGILKTYFRIDRELNSEYPYTYYSLGIAYRYVF